MESRTVIEPRVKQSFNKDLLSMHMVKKTTIMKINLAIIQELAEKKIRRMDTRKAKKYNELLRQWNEAYERKKIEEEEYGTALKNAPQKPSIPSTGGTIKFKKFER